MSRPGEELLRAVATMDRLRSPGGCPWDAEQTHQSLTRYVVEEAHEVVEAIKSGSREDLVEELGDLLLQVLFQARVGQDGLGGAEPFDIDDVAATLVAKLERRHPHVFADGDASTPADVEAEWERIKAEEKAAKAQRAARRPAAEPVPPLLHDIPRSLPSTLAAEKILARVERTGGDLTAVADTLAASEDPGDRMLAEAARCRAAGTTADDALRAALTRFATT